MAEEKEKTKEDVEEEPPEHTKSPVKVLGPGASPGSTAVNQVASLIPLHQIHPSDISPSQETSIQMSGKLYA